MMTLPPGTTLGRYEIISQLGAGGMGVVYLAQDTKLDRKVAPNIWIQPLDNNPPRQLTDFKSDRIFSFYWSPDGKWLALSRGPEQRDVVLMSDFK